MNMHKAEVLMHVGHRSQYALPIVHLEKKRSLKTVKDCSHQATKRGQSGKASLAPKLSETNIKEGKAKIDSSTFMLNPKNGTCQRMDNTR